MHGLESSEDGGNLTVHVSRDVGVIVVTIEDDGVGMDYYQLGKLRYAINSGEAAEKGHIGVSNVNQRLKLQYGELLEADLKGKSVLDMGCGTSILEKYMNNTTETQV